LVADDIYAQPREVSSLADCYFYHTMDIPGFGVVPGEWDLREGIADYLGHVDFQRKRVLEIGTASGFVCFHLESLGADVVSVDLSDREEWDIVPYAEGVPAKILADRRANAVRINNSYWLAHRAHGSHARVVYTTAYQLPASIGAVDIALFGSVLLHIRDPWLALERAARLTTDTLIVTDVAPSTDRELRFLPDPEKHAPVDTWWELSPDIIVRYLAVLGFPDAVVTRHRQRNPAGLMPFFTVVGRRRHAATGDAARHTSDLLKTSGAPSAPLPSAGLIENIRRRVGRIVSP
jgi:hypothetical protein